MKRRLVPLTADHWKTNNVARSATVIRVHSLLMIKENIGETLKWLYTTEYGHIRKEKMILI